jgi:hypothetical protein
MKTERVDGGVFSGILSISFYSVTITVFTITASQQSGLPYIFFGTYSYVVAPSSLLHVRQYYNFRLIPSPDQLVLRTSLSGTGATYVTRVSSSHWKSD